MLNGRATAPDVAAHSMPKQSPVVDAPFIRATILPKFTLMPRTPPRRASEPPLLVQFVAKVLALCTMIAVVAGSELAGAAEAPSDGEILALLQQHCVQCHAAEPTHEAFAKPPAGIMLETIEQVRRYAPRLRMQVVETRAMPLGNQTGMTEEDRERIAAWIEGRKE